jgi:hypothetical protein
VIPRELSSALQRAVIFARVRAQLRAEHWQLTERQIDLIARFAVELKLTRIRFADTPVSVQRSG